MNIETEIRSFIDKQTFERLKTFFDENGRLLKEDSQKTHYFDCEQDVRIQQNQFYAKIWLKKGNLHDDAREEIEIKVEKDQFEDLEKLFAALGYEVEIKWFRSRLQYEWQGITVCLDHTRGYGYILELEKMCTEDTQEEVTQELRAALEQLDVQETPKALFKEKYEYYKEHWKELV